MTYTDPGTFNLDELHAAVPAALRDQIIPGARPGFLAACWILAGLNANDTRLNDPRHEVWFHVETTPVRIDFVAMLGYGDFDDCQRAVIAFASELYDTDAADGDVEVFLSNRVTGRELQLARGAFQVVPAVQWMGAL
jgi:hypothetical protein